MASLIQSVLENEQVAKSKGTNPHIFVLDINGEYANALLSEPGNNYDREPNKAYVNGDNLSVPLWLMNSAEVCEWLSASEQTQQPVLKAWWAYLKSALALGSLKSQDFHQEALVAIRTMRAKVSSLKRDDVQGWFDNIHSFLSGVSGIDIGPLKSACDEHMDGTTHYSKVVGNGAQIAKALDDLADDVQKVGLPSSAPFSISLSGDTPNFVSLHRLWDSSSMVEAATNEGADKIEQHLTTLRMRLQTRLSDKRWSVLINYEDEGIVSTEEWFRSLGFTDKGPRVTVLDLSMLAHEVLPYLCAIIGRVLLETREKLTASERYQNPWIIVLEEAHNYARPPRQVEDRGQALSRLAFERIAKEGRKFGLSLVVASQRPSEISPTIISQCANFITHRLQNPDDIEHFRRIIPKQAQRLLDQVTVLSAGEAIVFGSSVHVPARVQVKKPRREPWSSSAAPYVEWSKDSRFPLDDVLSAWGVSSDEENAEEPAVTAVPHERDVAETDGPPVAEITGSDLDDEIPF